MRDRGYQVFVYTVNNLKEAKRFRDIGVSGVFTNRPDLLAPFAPDQD
jgi:glycerophosphoryl diester phosphodiesterase